MTNDRLKDAFGQLERYGGPDPRILDILDALTDVNDNLENGMADDVIAESVDRTRRLLDEVLPGRTRPTVLGPLPITENSIDMLDAEVTRARDLLRKKASEVHSLRAEAAAGRGRAESALRRLNVKEAREAAKSISRLLSALDYSEDEWTGEGSSALDEIADAAEELQVEQPTDPAT